VRSDHWAGRREESLKDFHSSAGQYNLNGSSLQVGQARNGHWVVDYTTTDQDGCTSPRRRSVCAVVDIIGKPEGLPKVKECLT